MRRWLRLWVRIENIDEEPAPSLAPGNNIDEEPAPSLAPGKSYWTVFPGIPYYIKPKFLKLPKL
jgi:hypothetical protein